MSIEGISKSLKDFYFGIEDKWYALIDKIDTNLSLNHGIVFQKFLNKTDLIVKDHQVHHQPI